MVGILRTFRQKPYIPLLFAIAGFIACVFVADSVRLQQLEQRIFFFVYDFPAFLTLIMYLITQTASAGALIMASVVAYLMGQKRAGYLIFASGALTLAVAYIAKEWIARPRPGILFENVITRYEYATGFGFPSGHTAIATALAVTFLPYVPRQHRYILIGWIVLVGFSRVYLGVHAPLDVIGGFLLGLAVGLLWRILIAPKKLAQKA